MSEAALREQLEIAEETIRQLREQLGQMADAEMIARGKAVFALPTTPMKLLAALVKAQRPQTKNSLLGALYADRINPPDPKIIDVFLHRLRRSLRPHGVSVETVKEVGYRLSPENRAKVLSLLGLEGQP